MFCMSLCKYSEEWLRSIGNIIGRYVRTIEYTRMVAVAAARRLILLATGRHYLLLFCRCVYLYVGILEMYVNRRNVHV